MSERKTTVLKRLAVVSVLVLGSLASSIIMAVPASAAVTAVGLPPTGQLASGEPTINPTHFTEVVLSISVTCDPQPQKSAALVRATVTETLANDKAVTGKNFGRKSQGLWVPCPSTAQQDHTVKCRAGGPNQDASF